MGDRRKLKSGVVRRLVFVGLALTLAVLACNVPGASNQPVLEPVQPDDSSLDSQAGEDGSETTPPQEEAGEPPSELSPDRIDQIIRASVQIWAGDIVGGRFESMWSGSGTLISPDGKILTNCHVACGAPVLLISMTTDPDQPPDDRYLAEITHYDDQLDLALLQIVSDINGSSVSPTDLPYLDIGDSDALRLGERIYVFGYPGVGGDTITFTSGAVSGFDSADISGESRRVIIKTDAEIASGNSGGTAVDLWGNLVAVPTAVNPDVREGVTLGGLGILRPVNLIEVVMDNPGSPPVSGVAGLPPSEDPDPFEPNDSTDDATPLQPGDSLTAFISWQDDLDFYVIEPRTNAPILINLNNIPFDTDYDLYLLDNTGEIVDYSESETPQEEIYFTTTRAGSYWVVVASYSGASTTAPYTLRVSYDDGGSSAGGSSITISGTAIDAYTGLPLTGGVFGVLNPGVNCAKFFGGSDLDLSLVTSSGETNSAGYFVLNNVPVGNDYTTFFVYGSDYICENDWLEVPSDAVDSDLGEIEMSFD